MLHKIYSQEEVIVCPHCRYEFKDSWEYTTEGELDCDRCGEQFHLEPVFDVTYSTYITHEQWKNKKESK